MNINQQNIDELNAVLTIKITPEDYNEKVESQLKKYGKQVAMPGFRAGKVPASLLKKKYGKSILAEEVNKLISDALHNHITENKLDVLGNPLPKEDAQKDIDWDNPTEMEFVYEIGLSPQFELNLSQKDKFPIHKIKVDDEIINKQVEDFGRRFGKLVSVDKSSDKDMLLGKFEQLDENGNLIEGGITHTSTVAIDFIEDKDAKKQLIGAAVSDQLILDPKKVSKGITDMAAMLGISKEQAEQIGTQFQFTVTEVKRMESAELNEELFKKVYGEDAAIATEAEFRNRIKTDMESMFEKDSDRLFRKHMIETLVEKTKLSLPNDFLKRWILATNDKNVSQEEIEKDYTNYSDQLRWQLIENKLIKDNDIKVENDEVISYTKQLLINNYAQYGIPAPADDQLTAGAMQVLKNQDEVRRIYEMIYQDKVVEIVKGLVKLDEKSVSYDDFVKLYQEKK
jgi:trigger factor